MDVIADYPLPAPKCRTLIQRNLIQPKLNRGFLAFDKCTLLSSQGSDAPAFGLSASLQGNFSILSASSSLSNRRPASLRLARAVDKTTAKSGSPIVDPEVCDSQGVCVLGGGSLLEEGRLSASPRSFGANKKDITRI